ncbi:unnamed protein product [Effrenium voratum]|nr:unnamed protein product [Effrenium voratum]|mmetsp:Transcript_60647/g.144531  ORF Transcript_60647/g.144531 Transcript_60647/m.144531 type:complete len:616 (+) Transcript_60647:94-1941(+)
MAESRTSRAKSIGHYVLMKTIGEGTFGKVKLGTHILTGERVAVKVLEKERIQELADVERVAREIHILKLIRRCRHIIQLYEIIETPRQLYLIMEYAPGGELFDYIVEHGRAEEKDACRFLHQILAGVERVHQTNVVHRDMKPENLLLDERECIKIVDFGLSNTFQDEQLLQTACGSPCYAAPEMIAGNQYFPPMVDVWSCGVILFALVCGFLPFEDQNHAELYKKILNAEYEVPNFISKDVVNLIAGMLTTDPEKRMTLVDIRNHKWYRQIPEASLKDREDDSLDEAILDQLDSYGFPREYAIKCLQSNKHNHVTTTYYLIKENQLRSEDAGLAAKRTIADIDATCFEDFAAYASPAVAVAMVATPSRGSRAGEESASKPGEDGCAMPEACQTSRSKAGAGPSPRGGRNGHSRSTGPPASGARRPAERSGAWASPRPRGGYSCDRVGGPPRRRPNSTDPAPFARRLCSPWGTSRGGYSATSGELLDSEYEVSPPDKINSARDRYSSPRPASYGVPPAAWRLGVQKARHCDEVSYNISQAPRQVMQEVTRALSSHGISFQQISSYVVRCQSQGVRFQAEIMQADQGGEFLLRFRKASGDVRSYKDLCARLLTSMNL